MHMRAMLPVYGLVFAPDDPAKFMRCYYGSDGTGGGGYVPDLEPPVLPAPAAPTSPATSDGAGGSGGTRAGGGFFNRPLLGGGGGMGAVGGLLHGFGGFARLGAGMGGPYGGGGDGASAAASALAPVLASIARLGAASFLKGVCVTIIAWPGRLSACECRYHVKTRIG